MLRPEWAGSKDTNQTKHTPYLIHKIELWGIYCKHFGETCYYNAIALYFGGASVKLHQPRLWFITGGYLVKHWFLPAAARARGQSNDLNREILASNLFNCRKEVINAPPVPSVPRCIHIVFRHKTYENISGPILFITAWVLFFTMFIAKMPSSTAAPLAVKGANH